MQTIGPKAPLFDIHKAPVRRIGLSWQDALRAVGSVGMANPTANLVTILKTTQRTIADAEGDQMTLRDALLDALLTGKAADECTAELKLKRWNLAKKIEASETIELEAKEVVFLDDCLASTFKTAVYGPARDALNGVQR